MSSEAARACCRTSICVSLKGPSSSSRKPRDVERWPMSCLRAVSVQVSPPHRTTAARDVSQAWSTCNDATRTKTLASHGAAPVGSLFLVCNMERSMGLERLAADGASTVLLPEESCIASRRRRASEASTLVCVRVCARGYSCVR